MNFHNRTRAALAAVRSHAAVAAPFAPWVAIPVFMLLAWAFRAPDITLLGDDAVYLLLSDSIRDFSYRETYTPGHPVHAHYPPLYPALLALGSFLLGNRPDHLALVGIAAAAGGLLVFWVGVRAFFGAVMAAAALVLAALNPALIETAGLLMSEAPFFALTALAIWAASRPTARWTGVAVAAAVGAGLTRAVGIAVILAVLITWLLARRWRASAVLALCTALTVGAWLAWTFTAPGRPPDWSYSGTAAGLFSESADSPYLQDGRTESPPSSAAREQEAQPRSTIPVALAKRVVNNARVYLTRDLGWLLPAATSDATDVDDWLWAALIVLLGGAGFVQLWRRWRAAALLLTSYGGILLVWPLAFGRFLLPVLPFILLVLLLGARAIGARMRAAPHLLPVVLVAAIAGRAAAQDVGRARAIARCDRARATGSPECFTRDQVALFNAARFARATTDERERFVLGSKWPTFAYYARREVIPLSLVAGDDASQTLANLDQAGVRYVVVTHLLKGDPVFARQLTDVCDRLELVSSFDRSTFMLRVKDDVSVDRSACDALQRYEFRPSDIERFGLW